MTVKIAKTDAEIRKMFIEEVVKDLAKGMAAENKAARRQISRMEDPGVDEVAVTLKMIGVSEEFVQYLEAFK
jgi:hypothetical protein